MLNLVGILGSATMGNHQKVTSKKHHLGRHKDMTELIMFRKNNYFLKVEHEIKYG